MTVTCILPHMLPIRVFPIPNIKGKHEGTLAAAANDASCSLPRSVHCKFSSLCCHAAAVKHLDKAEKEEQRRVFALWENKGMRNGDISVTKSMFWILHGDFSNGLSLLVQQNNLDVIS